MTRLPKKVIAIMLTALLVITSVPFTAFASEGLTRLNEAIDAYESAMDGTVYTNMKNAYLAYYEAVKVRDTATYGTRDDLNLDALAQNLETATAAMKKYEVKFNTVTPSFHGDDLTAYAGTAYNNLLYSPQVGTDSDAGATGTAENTNANVKYALYYAQTVFAYDGTTQLRMPVMISAQLTYSKTRYIYGCYPITSAENYANHPYLSLPGYWYSGDNVTGWSDDNNGKDGNWSFAAQLDANLQTFGYNNETGYGSNQSTDHRSQELPQYGTLFWWQGRTFFAANMLDINYTFAQGEYLKTFQPHWYICASESTNSANDLTTMRGNNIIYVINLKALSDSVFSTDYANVLKSVGKYNKDNADMATFLGEFDKATSFNINSYDYTDTEAKANACATQIKTLVDNLALANNALDVSNTTDYSKLFSAISDYKAVYEAGNTDSKYPAETWSKFVDAYEGAIAAVNNIPENGYVDDFSDKPVASIAEALDFLLDKDGTCGVDNEYSYDSTTGVVTITGTGTMENYGETGNSPFAGNTKITKVVIEEGVTSIGDYAFYDCTNLKEVNIPSTVTSVGVSAFENCSSLETIEVPAGARYEDNAFDGCDNLESVTISSGEIASHEEDDYNAPWYQPTVKTLVITNGVTLIGENAFSDATNIVKLSVPCDIPINTASNTNAFRGMTSLKYITITKGKTGVMIDWTGNYTRSPWYGNNTNARLEITVESGVKNIGAHSFRGCDHIFVMDLPATVSRIGDRAFLDCTALDDITIYDKDCVIYDAASTFDKNTTIHGYEYSTAQEYATKYQRDFIPLGAHSHNWVEKEVIAPTCEGQGYTIYECSGCHDTKNDNYEQALGHDYQKTSTVVDPTCVTEGYTVYECSRCHAKDNRDFTPALQHDYKVKEVISPTCIDDGYTVYKCSRCTSEYSSDFIDAGDAYHKYNTNTVNPTCTAQGYTEYECEYCHTTYKDNYVSALGHDYHLTTHVDANCQHGGYDEYECSRCHGKELRNQTQKTDHDWQINSVVGSTCSAQGYTEYKCSMCETTKKDYMPIDPDAHSYHKTKTEAPTCTAKGYDEYECEYCHKTYKNNYVNALGHDWVILKTYPATCTQEGYDHCECSRCYKNEYRNYTDKLEHDWQAVKTEEPTCTKQGYTEYECSMCHTNKTDDYVDPLGHNYVENGDVSRASFTTEGSVNLKCTTCGDNYNKRIASPTAALKKAVFVYNGKVFKPTVIVKDGDGNVIDKSQYTVTYSKGRKNVGKYVAKVTFNKDCKYYFGSKSLAFKINPKPTTIKKLKAGTKQLTVTWNKRTVQTKGYEIQVSTDSKFKKGVKKYTVNKNTTAKKVIKKLKYNTVYYVRIRTYQNVNKVSYVSTWSKAKKVKVKPVIKNVVIRKATAGKKKLTVKWKAVKGLYGYEIQYSTNANMKKAKTVKIVGTKKATTTIKKLKSKKKYYVRIRAVKKIKKTKYYGNWSKVKAVKVK
ncbi:MAG: leucine-rich repeat protein [Eubacterium sp.]|nr:leucine-rich repeat protein [Eubacterium sp.]